MSSFIIVYGDATDAAGLKEYSAGASPLVGKHGGEFLVKGSPKTLVGGDEHSLAAVIRFPNKEKADAWFNSEEYQAFSKLRDASFKGSFLQLDGD